MGAVQVWVAAVLLMGTIGCRAEFSLGPEPPRGASPQADAGTGTTLRFDQDLVLDGSRSLDPDGSITAYRWRIVSAPLGSVAAILDETAMVTTFPPDVDGTFSFELEVTDNDGNSDVSRVDFVVAEAPLVVNAGADINIAWREIAQLTGTYAVQGPQTPTVSWSFVSKPAQSLATLQNASTLTPSFVADAEGTYVIEINASTLQHTDVDTVTVIASAPRTTFEGTFIHAEFTAEHVVVTSDSPPRVRFIHTLTGIETSIPLPSTPTAFAVDPYRDTLAVATAGQVHIVSVFTKAVTGTFNVPFAVSDLVVGPYQFVQCFTPQAGPIQTIDLATGTVTQSATSVAAGTVGARTEMGSTLYVLEPNGSPPDLTNYYAGSAPAEREYDSPYAGEYPLGTDLWIFGDTILVDSGRVFDSHSIQGLDMVYRGQLTGGEPAALETLFHYSTRIATLHTVSSTSRSELRFYDPTSLVMTQSLPVPDILVNGLPQPGTGRVLGFVTTIAGKIYFVASAGSSNAIFAADL